MSISCNIVIEFHHQLSVAEVESLQSLMERNMRHFSLPTGEVLWVQDASNPVCEMQGYSGFSVDDNGTLYDDEQLGQVGKVSGCGYNIASGAVGWARTNGRWWDKSYPEGPMPEYAVILLTLLASPLVKRCWYYPNDTTNPQAMTRAGVHALLDEYAGLA